MKRRFVITDHALVRWLERRHGMDMEFFREAMAAEIPKWLVPGHVKATVIDGIEFRFDESGRVATVVPTVSEKRAPLLLEWREKA